MRYRFTAPLWLHTGDAAWHFVTLPEAVADEIDELTEHTKKGFGSAPVRATIGDTIWATSIFPDSKRRSYVLPVKKAVRAAEDIDDGDVVEVTVELRVADD